MVLIEFKLFFWFFERAARTTPRLLKPHFDSLSKIKIEQCSAIYPQLIKFVKILPFSLVKSIIREWIVQIQSHSRSFENVIFFINVLRQFFGKPSSASKNPELFRSISDDYNISSTIVNEEKGSKTDNNYSYFTIYSVLSIFYML